MKRFTAKPIRYFSRILVTVALCSCALLSDLPSAEPVVAWTALFDGAVGRTNVSDRAKKVAVDDAGNVYVSGDFGGFQEGNNYGTVKYSADGVPLWTNLFHTGSVGSMAVDRFGNVYVAGTPAIIKYEPDGTPVWTNIHPMTLTAMAVDGSGNVHVTGRLFNAGQSQDYVTIKYGTDGRVAWTNSYNGPASGEDVARSVAVDDSGNVYVTGSSVGVGSQNDYATIKYLADGTASWTNRHNGPANSHDFAVAVAVAVTGNVYVTGWVRAIGGPDYATIKYRPDGTAVWTNHYAGPASLFTNPSDQATALVVDQDENVHVTGSSFNDGANLDFATIKYRSDGTALWTNRYDGLGVHIDEATAVAVDNAGNAFVTGRSYSATSSGNFAFDYTTIKYRADGLMVWVNRYNGPINGDDNAVALFADLLGNVYVTGDSAGLDSGPDYVTIKYLSDGSPAWTNRCGSIVNSIDVLSAIATDNGGNIYLSGSTAGPGWQRDRVLIKYGPDGIPEWTKQYDLGDDEGSLVLDNAGSIYIAWASGNRFVLVKYQQDGVAAWTNRVGTKVAWGPALAADDSGSVYFTGMFSESGWHYRTIRFRQDGSAIWTNNFPLKGDIDAVPAPRIVVGSDGVYLSAADASGGNWDYVTIKYHLDGTSLWTNRFGGQANLDDRPSGLIVDRWGSGYVTGTSYFSTYPDPSRAVYATIKYHSDGTAVWTNFYSGLSNLYNSASAVGVDSTGNAYVTGVAEDTLGIRSDYVTVKYHPDGTALWTNRYDGFGGWDAAYLLTLDKADNIYIAGRSQISGGATAWATATIKYRPDGTAMWTNRFVSEAHLNDQLRGIAITPAGAVIVAGYSENVHGGYDYLAYQLSQADNQLPAVLSITSASGSVRIRGGGFPGQSYNVQRTSDFVAWATIYTGSASSRGILEFEDDAPPTNSFYRIVVP